MWIYREISDDRGKLLGFEVGYFTPDKMFECMYEYEPNERLTVENKVNFLNGGGN